VLIGLLLQTPEELANDFEKELFSAADPPFSILDHPEQSSAL
jgi:hypothetical protein